MKIGKREKIVFGSVCTLVAIGAFHFFIFQPNAREYHQNKQDLMTAEQEFQSFQRLSNSQQLVNFNENTFARLTELKTGIDQLGMTLNPAFVLGFPQDLELEFPPNTSKEEQQQIRNNKYAMHVALLVQDQITLVVDEVKKLRKTYEDSSRTRLTFLEPNPDEFEKLNTGQWVYRSVLGWGLPTELPEAMRTGVIWDQAQKIAETKNTLQYIHDKTTPLYIETRNAYERDVAMLGMDLERAKMLPIYGQFVPYYYKLCFASLLLDRQDKLNHPVLVLQEELNRIRLFGLLEIDEPNAPMPGTQDSELYFVYNQIKAINDTIDVMREVGESSGSSVAEVLKVTAGAYSFLEQMEVTLDDPSDPDEVAASEMASAAPGGMSASAALKSMGGTPGMLGTPGRARTLGTPGAGGTHRRATAATAATANADEVNNPKAKTDTDIGYALPITFRIRTNNKTLWAFVYEVLRRDPLAELHSLKVESLGAIRPDYIDPISRQKLSEIVATYGEDTLIADVQFVFVLRLFGTLDTVRDLDQLAANSKMAPKPVEAAPDAAATATP